MAARRVSFFHLIIYLLYFSREIMLRACTRTLPQAAKVCDDQRSASYSESLRRRMGCAAAWLRQFPYRFLEPRVSSAIVNRSPEVNA
jgi:hypothetical protein